MVASPESARRLPFIVAKTLGSAMGSAHLASIFPLFMQVSKTQPGGGGQGRFSRRTGPGPVHLSGHHEPSGRGTDRNTRSGEKPGGFIDQEQENSTL